jgi:hypothetical protein
MRAIKVKNKAFLLPDSWEDLKYSEKIFTFKILIRVMSGDLKYIPHIGLLKLLIKYTGYVPVSFIIYRLDKLTRYYLKSLCIHLLNIPYGFKYGWQKYRLQTGILKAAHRPDSNSEDAEREIIDLGLLRLAESIDFVYTIDPYGKIITPLYTFKTNPFPFIRIGKRKYIGKRFFVTLTTYTDITARSFVDALDLLMLMDRASSREDKDECMCKICAILYPALADHNENMLSGHHKRMRRLDPIIKFGIVYWFTGIVNIFRTSETYRALFERTGNQQTDGDKISIGMNEIALFLKKEGYGDPEKMNLVEYFDAQVKALKDYLSKAIAEGVTPAKIQDKTGIPADIINKLT